MYLAGDWIKLEIILLTGKGRGIVGEMVQWLRTLVTLADGPHTCRQILKYKDYKEGSETFFSLICRLKKGGKKGMSEEGVGRKFV